MTHNYAFISAYCEWHFIDKGNPSHVILNWQDPVDSLYYEFSEETGDVYEEPVKMTSFNEVLNECDLFINNGLTAFENGEEKYHGVSKKDFMSLPLCASRIMAQALYDHYIG